MFYFFWSVAFKIIDPVKNFEAINTEVMNPQTFKSCTRSKTITQLFSLVCAVFSSGHREAFGLPQEPSLEGCLLAI